MRPLSDRDTIPPVNPGLKVRRLFFHQKSRATGRVLNQLMVVSHCLFRQKSFSKSSMILQYLAKLLIIFIINIVRSQRGHSLIQLANFLIYIRCLVEINTTIENNLTTEVNITIYGINGVLTISNNI